MSDKGNTATTSTKNSDNQSASSRPRSRRQNNKRRRTQGEDRKSFWENRPQLEPEEVTQEVEQDECFGNHIDYVPKYGNGIGGVYREPMDGKNNWAHKPRRRHNSRHANYHEEQPEGVLTMRMPGWKERSAQNNQQFDQEDGGVLTIRQQSDLSRSLRYNAEHPSAQLSRYEQGHDPAQAWQRFMDDLKTGRTNSRKKRSDDRRRRGQQKRQTNG